MCDFGLLLTSDTGPGIIRFTANGSNSGALSIIVKDDKDKNILKTVNDTVTISNKQISIDLTALANDKSFHVWIKYTPSLKSTLSIGKIYYERKV